MFGAFKRFVYSCGGHEMVPTLTKAAFLHLGRICPSSLGKAMTSSRCGEIFFNPNAAINSLP